MPKCPKCSKEVYFAERVTSLGKDWHRPCLKCDRCSKSLTPGAHAEHEGKPYCHVPCYSALYGPKGFGHGGTESHAYWVEHSTLQGRCFLSICTILSLNIETLLTYRKLLHNCYYYFLFTVKSEPKFLSCVQTLCHSSNNIHLALATLEYTYSYKKTITLPEPQFLNFSRNWAWDFLKFVLTFTEINWPI